MRVAVIALAACLWSLPASARLTQTAKVRYDTSEGESSWQQTDVTFLTGSELNELTSSIRYNSFKSYAAIFFGKTSTGEAKIAVIRVDDPSVMFCGQQFDSNCLPLLGKMKGPDQEGRAWEICTGIVC
jgi:hypothetical protein